MSEITVDNNRYRNPETLGYTELGYIVPSTSSDSRFTRTTKESRSRRNRLGRFIDLIRRLFRLPTLSRREKSKEDAKHFLVQKDPGTNSGDCISLNTVNKQQADYNDDNYDDYETVQNERAPAPAPRRSRTLRRDPSTHMYAHESSSTSNSEGSASVETEQPTHNLVQVDVEMAVVRNAENSGRENFDSETETEDQYTLPDRFEPQRSGDEAYAEADRLQPIMGESRPRRSFRLSAVRKANVLKIAVIGDKGVGKSCLLRSLLQSNSLVVQSETKIVVDGYIEDEPVTMEFLEFEGPLQRLDVQSLSDNNLDALLICFSLVSPASYKSVQTHWCSALSKRCPRTSILLIGTKLDLRGDTGTTDNENLTVVTKSEGIQLAKTILVGPDNYLELSTVSSEESHNVLESIMTVMKLSREARLSSRLNMLGPVALDESYPVTQPTGHFLLINVHKYNCESEFSDRVGSDIDVESLSTLFTELDFVVKKLNNPKSHEIFEFIYDELTRRDELSKIGCFILFVMGHGSNGRIYDREGEEVKISSITKRFRANECEALRDKPKLFFFQACRGKSVFEQRGLAVDAPQSSSVPARACDADTLMCFANTEGNATFRDESKGSLYVQALSKVISEEYQCNDILSMMTSVAYRLKNTPVQHGHRRFSTVSETVSRLTKKCYLDPSRALSQP